MCLMFCERFRCSVNFPSIKCVGSCANLGDDAERAFRAEDDFIHIRPSRDARCLDTQRPPP